MYISIHVHQSPKSPTSIHPSCLSYNTIPYHPHPHPHTHPHSHTLKYMYALITYVGLCLLLQSWHFAWEFSLRGPLLDWRGSELHPHAQTVQTSFQQWHPMWTCKHTIHVHHTNTHTHTQEYSYQDCHANILVHLLNSIHLNFKEHIRKFEFQLDVYLLSSHCHAHVLVTELRLT